MNIHYSRYFFLFIIIQRGDLNRMMRKYNQTYDTMNKMEQKINKPVCRQSKVAGITAVSENSHR